MTDTVIHLEDKKIPRELGALCEMGCDGGDFCFCILGNDLMKHGMAVLKKEWPATVDSKAASTVADLVLQDRYGRLEQEPAVAEEFIKLLIAHVVYLAFRADRGPPDGTDHVKFHKRMKDEAAARAAIEKVLGEQLRAGASDA